MDEPAAGPEPDSPSLPPAWFGGVASVVLLGGTDSGFDGTVPFRFVWRVVVVFFVVALARGRVAAGFSGWDSFTDVSATPASIVSVNELD